MYLPIPQQPDCASAWYAAATAVDKQPGHEAHNVIIGVDNPLEGVAMENAIVARVDSFLQTRGKSVSTIANTIFPQALYERHGAAGFIKVFHDKVLPKVRKNERWSGYYFERMTRVPRAHGDPLDMLSITVQRMRDPKVKSLNKFELSLFDAERDVDNSPYGGQCLSFLSFKLEPGEPRRLHLTAIYRNHYYGEKLLGNLIGLGRVMAFVAHEANLSVGSLTIVSTHAVLDTVGGTRADISKLLNECGVAAPAA